MTPGTSEPHDDLGRPVRLAAPPQRVVSLVPSLTEAIVASAPGLLVGATSWCTHPPDLAVTRVRGTKNPDLATILELQPDLVVANQEENRAVDVEALEAAGIPVWVTAPTTVAAALTSLDRLLLVACGLAARPDWLDEANAVWAAPPRIGPASAAVLIWKKPWMVVGADTFAGDLLARLGISNVFAGADGRYPRSSVEEIRTLRPDLVVLPDEPYVFTPDDGPESFEGLRCVLVSGRSLTWYGPSLVAARSELEAALA